MRGMAPAPSLRRRIVLIAVASILPLAVLSAVVLTMVYQQRREAEQLRTLETTRALASAVESELQRTISGLQSLAVAIEQDDVDLASFHDLARRALARQPLWKRLVLRDLEGRGVADSEFPGVRENLPESPERESIEAAIRAGKPVVGNIVQGRMGWSVAVRVPILANGKPRYLLSAIVPPDSIREIVQRQRTSDDWVISVFDVAGRRVARSRPDQFLGTTGHKSLVDLMAPGTPEGMGITTTYEGDELFTAYARSADFGWTVAMGLPQALVVAPALRFTELWALALALSILGGLAAAFALARRIDEREALLRTETAARAEAEAANRAKDQFLAMLGHELRNPIAAISNATQLLEHGDRDPALAHRARDIVKRQVAHLARLTDDLLDAARAILGKIELRQEPVDLAVAARNAYAALVASGRGAAHRFQCDLQPAWVRGDPMRLEQVVTNLLVNAVKYTPQGGQIRLATGIELGQACVTVADDGIGMSPELVARAFELFVQGRSDIDRSQGGLGIGLTLVRRLAELHGGSAAVASAGDGRGTTVTVRLPLSTPEGAAAGGAGSTRAGRALQVLVVEDNEDARESLRALLELKGHHVEVAADGGSGVEKGLAMAPDLAIVDIGLPGLSGYEVARRLRASPLMGATWLVALTGYGTSDARDAALASGFDQHLTKPIAPEQLDVILAKVAQRPVAARAG